MKKQSGNHIKSGPDKFVRIMKKLFVIFAVIAIPTLMVCLVYAFNASGTMKAVFIVLSCAVALLFLFVYGFYAMHVSMGTVLGVQTTEKVVHLVTKRKTFTYDVRMGCIEMRKKRNRFIGTFATQDSRDKFVFYSHAPFSKWSDEQFSEEDIRKFYARIDEVSRA